MRWNGLFYTGLESFIYQINYSDKECKDSYIVITLHSVILCVESQCMQQWTDGSKMELVWFQHHLSGFFISLCLHSFILSKITFSISPLPAFPSTLKNSQFKQWSTLHQEPSRVGESWGRIPFVWVPLGDLRARVTPEDHPFRDDGGGNKDYRREQQRKDRVCVWSRVRVKEIKA